MRVRIPQPVIQQARNFAQAVFEARGDNPDKFTQGDELAADIRGFEVEFAHSFAYRQPFPQLKKGREVDKGYDTFLYTKDLDICHGLAIDIKASDNFLINKEQYERKYGKVDAYLFETIDFINWQQDIIFLKIHGWIFHSDVPNVAEEVTFPNGSTAYKIKKRNLQNPRELHALYQPEKEAP